jgi:hypothetical protein
MGNLRPQIQKNSEGVLRNKVVNQTQEGKTMVPKEKTHHEAKVENKIRISHNYD